MDVGAALLITALAIQQGLAYGWARAIAIAGALALYYIAARVVIWAVTAAWRRAKARPLGGKANES